MMKRFKNDIEEQIKELQAHADHYEMKQGNKNSHWHDRIKVLKLMKKDRKEESGKEEINNG